MGRLSNIVIRFAYVVHIYARVRIIVDVPRPMRLKHYPGYISTGSPGVMSGCSTRHYVRSMGLQGREGEGGRTKKIPVAVVGSESYIIAVWKLRGRCIDGDPCLSTYSARIFHSTPRPRDPTKRNIPSTLRREYRSFLFRSLEPSTELCGTANA